MWRFWSHEISSLFPTHRLWNFSLSQKRTTTKKCVDNYFYPILQKKRMTKKVIFQQDGAPAHFSKAVRSWLDEKFHDRWIGRDGLQDHQTWHRWTFSKQIFIKTKVRDIDDLKARIIEEVEAIKTETLRNVFMEISERLNFCISIKGDTFEQYF